MVKGGRGGGDKTVKEVQRKQDANEGSLQQGGQNIELAESQVCAPVCRTCTRRANTSTDQYRADQTSMDQYRADQSSIDQYRAQQISIDQY